MEKNTGRENGTTNRVGIIMTLKLEVGKTYINENGDLIKIIHYDNKLPNNYYFIGIYDGLDYTDIYLYTENGDSQNSLHLAEEKIIPFSVSGIRWIGYSYYKDICDLNSLLNKAFHEEKDKLPWSWKKKMKLKITIEEVPETEDDN